MLKKVGFIEATSRDGKRFKMDGDWYSAFSSSQMNGASEGDYVRFVYKEKASATGGDPFRNVQGTVTKEVAPADAVPSGTMVLGGGSPVRSGALPHLDAKGYVLKQFPIPAFHPDR